MAAAMRARCRSSPRPSARERCNQLWFDPILRRLAQRLPSVTCAIAAASNRSSEKAAASSRRCAISRATGSRRSPRAISSLAAAGDSMRAARRSACKMGGRAGALLSSQRVPAHARAVEPPRQGQGGVLFLRQPESADSPASSSSTARELWRLGINLGHERVAPEDVDVAGHRRRVHRPGHPLRGDLGRCPGPSRSIVADSWQPGRCFLAGDAVHQHGPSGGFGMNTGLGDAVDLGWKLAAAVEGWGGPTLLGELRDRAPAGGAARRRRGAREPGRGHRRRRSRAHRRARRRAGDAARARVGEEIVRQRTRVYHLRRHRARLSLRSVADRRAATARRRRATA